MKIRLRENIYVTVFGGTRKQSCEGCAFFSCDEGICTAPIPIYKSCPPPGKVFRHLNKFLQIFNL